MRVPMESGSSRSPLSLQFEPLQPYGSTLSAPADEFDLFDDLGRAARRYVPSRDVLRDDGVRSDHAAVSDRDAARDDAIGAEPAVVADAGRALGGKPLPGDRLVGIVELVRPVRDEAAVGEHAVVADLHELV